MIIYEVNVEIDDEINDQYEGWLRGHIPEVVKLGGFKGAKVYKNNEKNQWIVHYQVEEQQTLDEYLKGPAQALRADAERLFSGRYQAQRRVYQHVDSF